MPPIQTFNNRRKLRNTIKFISIVFGVTVVGVLLLINVRALTSDNQSKKPNSASVPKEFAAGPSPSGKAMPLGNLEGWKQVFTDDFPGDKLDPHKWQAYIGPAGGVPNTLWDPANALVNNGMLELKTTQVDGDNEKWVAAGVSSAAALHQTYGKYSVRFKIEHGEGITGLVLLWPVDNKWPPEIDFVENGGNRNYIHATLHHSSDNQKIQHRVEADFTQWHTVGVEWQPGQLRYLLDDAIWATVESPYVPTVPMALDMQTQTGICGNVPNPCPNATTPKQVSMYVDWAVAYESR